MSFALVLFLVTTAGFRCDVVSSVKVDAYGIHVSCDRGAHRYVIDDYPPPLIAVRKVSV